jgi:hypothetical protein
MHGRDIIYSSFYSSCSTCICVCVRTCACACACVYIKLLPSLIIVHPSSSEPVNEPISPAGIEPDEDVRTADFTIELRE